MAAALHPSSNNVAHAGLYSPQTFDLDYKDTRYPTSISPNVISRASALTFGPTDRSGWDQATNPNEQRPASRNYDLQDINDPINTAWRSDQQRSQQQNQSRLPAPSADLQSVGSQSHQSQPSQEPQRGAVSYALQPGAPRRVLERYSLDNNGDRVPPRDSAEGTRHIQPPTLRQAMIPAERPAPGSSRPQKLGSNSGGAGPSNGLSMPLAASPSYSPPVAPNHRAYAQQPTYITPPTTPTPTKPVYSTRPPQEEVCIECAMRDEDMADVDVTSPGVWDRKSDADFEELKRIEDGCMEQDIALPEGKPRIKGGRLTEDNVKLWLSINPRETSSRHHTVKTYVISQRKLLEAEAQAHANANREAQQLDSRMRDTYSQLRKSAYDLGSSGSPTDDIGGLRIKPPLSPTSPHNIHHRSASREVTLLENGMIVEHVDVRREEREARDRQRKEVRRARKSSRSSTMDVTSVISGNSVGFPATDSGVGLQPYSHYSQAASGRPMSIATSPHERIPRAYSQASFSDVHSLASGSPRRSRFLGMKNLTGWRSQDSLAASGISGMTGSMVDMHVALQREGNRDSQYNTSRRSRLWYSIRPESVQDSHGHQNDEAKPKKKKGLAKLWGKVTGSSKNAAKGDANKQAEKTTDDTPLAPPPPMAYLMNRTPVEMHNSGSRHASNPSLPNLLSSSKSNNLPPGMAAPVVAPGILPSPPSSRISVTPDPDFLSEDKENHYNDYTLRQNRTLLPPKSIHVVTSEPDIRLRHVQNSPIAPSPTATFANGTMLRPPSLYARDKSLPPLPTDEAPLPMPIPRQPSNHGSEPRPRTVYTFDSQQRSPGPYNNFSPPNPAFRTADTRRQSFGGVSSRPTLGVQTVPVNYKQHSVPEPRGSFGRSYNEFGASRRSLGPIDQFKEYVARPNMSNAQTTKRKSKFGFASLLGKNKSISHEPEYLDVNAAYQFASSQEGSIPSGYPTSTSRHSVFSANVPTARMSVHSRKALEELVPQDSDFVAYRYPSNDQRLDLLR